HVEYRARRTQGADRRRRRRLPARPDRYPALPQSPEQPVIRGLEGTVVAPTVPFCCPTRHLTVSAARLTVKALGRKLPARFSVVWGGTMRGLLHISVMGALLAGATAVITAAPAQAQGSYSPYNESPAAALARYVHLLAD